MFNFGKKKPAKKLFYVVKIGYSNAMYFASEDEAHAMYRVLATANMINIDHIMVDKYNPEKNDYSGYEYLYYLGDVRNEVSLTTEEMDLYPYEEAKAIREQISEAKIELEEQNKLEKKSKATKVKAKR